MRGRVAKPRRTCRSRPKLAKVSQEILLAAIASESAGKGLPPNHSEQSPVSRDIAQETTPLQSDKRQPDAASEIHSFPAKRARSTQTNTQRPGVKDVEAEQAAKTTLQPPKPKPPKRPYASSLESKVERPEQVSLATRLRKRKIGSDSNDNEQRLKRVRLTRNNLALFNEMARKKGANKASASAPPESTVDSSTTRTTSTTTSGFAIQAYKNGILNPSSSKPPTNLKKVCERAAGSRGTASPTESTYEGYVDTVDRACNEATMVFEVGRQLLKNYPKGGYTRALNQAFTGFPKDVGFNNGLSAPQPDFVEGPEMQDYRPFPVDEYVNGAVLHKDNPRSVTLPHLAGEWKGPGKDMKEATLQSSYVGAALVYARNEALSYIGKSDPPGHAEITTFTTDGTNLNLYAHYAAPSEDGTLEYHQYPIRSKNLTNSHQELKDGRRGLRNEQDHARKQSYILRDELKEHWKQHRGVLQPIVKGAPLPVDSTFVETNRDDDEASYKVVEQPCQLTPAASSQPCKASSSVSFVEVPPTYK